MHKTLRAHSTQHLIRQHLILPLIVAVITSTVLPLSVSASNDVTTGTFIIEPPTLLCAGFEWNIGGDDNRNAAISVCYREKGASQWKDGPPLLRLHGEKTVFRKIIDYSAPNMFAGSIFDLTPGTEYECRFVMSDPDGVKGESTKTVSVTTRSEPKVYDGGRKLHVYPPDYEGTKEEPSFIGLSKAYFGSGQGCTGDADQQDL